MNLQSLSRDVAAFLVNPADSERVASFCDYIASVKFQLKIRFCLISGP